MIDPFYLASIPEPRTILGLRLKPFSLGHVILLHRIESAFVTDGVPDYNDLAASVFICALSYQDAVESLNDPDTEKVMRLWYARYTGEARWSVRLGFRKPRLVDLTASCRAFTEYITEHSRSPKYQFNPGDFSEMECPRVQVVKLTLMRELHISESQIMDRSWGLCLCDYIALKALDGEVTLYKQEDMDEALEVARRVSENIKNGKFRCPS